MEVIIVLVIFCGNIIALWFSESEFCEICGGRNIPNVKETETHLEYYCPKCNCLIKRKEIKS